MIYQGAAPINDSAFCRITAVIV